MDLSQVCGWNWFRNGQEKSLRGLVGRLYFKNGLSMMKLTRKSHVQNSSATVVSLREFRSVIIVEYWVKKHRFGTKMWYNLSNFRVNRSLETFDCRQNMVFEFGDDMPKCNCIVCAISTSSGSFIRYWLLISDDIVECNIVLRLNDGVKLPQIQRYLLQNKGQWEVFYGFIYFLMRFHIYFKIGGFPDEIKTYQKEE